MTARATPEWIGKSPDTPIPPRVKARVFQAHGGICHISGRKISAGEKWDCDHKVALINGGENRESNLAPALCDKHREKTRDDVAEKSTIARKQAKHLGITQPKGNIKSAGFAPPAKKISRTATPDKMATLPRRSLYK